MSCHEHSWHLPAFRLSCTGESHALFCATTKDCCSGCGCCLHDLSSPSHSPNQSTKPTCGQGLFAARVAGGGSISSRLITLVAPCLRLVAMQSVPVSPPPMTIT